jgi:pimeloyl-ACP methyl ester carboxylesterase
VPTATEISLGSPTAKARSGVVWLHGWARRGQDFAVAASQLASAGVASVALDLPGFGSSPAPASSGGARHYADLLVAALRGFGDEPLVLVGHSFGGRVATVIAATHPELVRALVLTGVPLIRTSSNAKSPLAYRIVRWLHSRGLLGDPRLEAARQKYGSTDYRRASGVLRDVLVAAVHESYEDELRRLRAPVAMVWGAHDSEVPVEVARRAATMVVSPHTLRVVAEVGHLLPTEAPGELVDAVREALA